MKRCFQYRIYPTKNQEKRLLKLLSLACWLYNAAIEERRTTWKKHRKSVSYYEQAIQLRDIRSSIPEMKLLNFSASQQVLRRVEKSYQGFFSRRRNGLKAGLPRFKSLNRFRTIEFTFGDGASLKEDRLYIQNVGCIKVRWHREIPRESIIKRVSVTRKVDKWYVTFSLEFQDRPVSSNRKPPIGIDLGVASIIATSKGELIESPRWFKHSEERLVTLQRILSKKQRGSKRYRRLRWKIARLHQHIANQRRDFWHKVTTQLVNRYGLIVVEDLNIDSLSRSQVAKGIHDCGWGMGIQMLDYKASSAGSQVIKVPARNTSQECSVCGNLVKKSLSVRVHNCPHCGFSCNRDINAAKVILQRGLRLSGSERAFGDAEKASYPKEAVSFTAR